jgi:hypothetical protein
VGAIALQLLGWYVLHPLLVDRGTGRPDSVAGEHRRAGDDDPRRRARPGSSRTRGGPPDHEVDLQRAVGARMVPLGTFTTRLGPFGMSLPEDRGISPYQPQLDPQVTGDQSPVPFEPDRLGDGTAVTVELWWREPVDLATADAVADVADDLALLWVGFRVPGGDEHRSGLAARLQRLRRASRSTSGEQGAPASAGDGFEDVGRSGGAEHALREVRRATANLAAIGWPGDGTTAYGALEDPAATAEVLASTEPAVDSVVITGPTQAVAAAVERYAPDQVDLLELDFDRGAPRTCL